MEAVVADDDALGNSELELESCVLDVVVTDAVCVGRAEHVVTTQTEPMLLDVVINYCC